MPQPSTVLNRGKAPKEPNRVTKSGLEPKSLKCVRARTEAKRYELRPKTMTKDVCQCLDPL